MLPSLVSREIQSGIKHFLRSSFPMTTPGFMHPGDKTTLEVFLDQAHALCKGPWLEVKLPFRSAETGEPLPFRHIDLPFTPYRHQHEAFSRLCRALPLSTLVATGTGSGKTECFMYPLFDYCLEERRPGIKAIIVYPMNALATDQARRFAKEVAKLDTKLSVGLFTGDDGTQNRAMTPEQVITHRDTLRDNPPDILLTNYKMLDFLLMRPKDQRLWRHNVPGLLRYLVVDELHTFDGAQGTDLACLIRRFRDKLKIGNELACVGTSATIGDDQGIQSLCNYASDVFATTFDKHSIILEDRLTVDEYLKLNDGHEVISHWPRENLDQLFPGRHDQAFYLRQVARLWLEKDLPLDDRDELRRQQASVELGVLLRSHTAFEALLKAAHKVCDLNELASNWHRYFNLTVDHDKVLLLIDSLCALISAARVWRVFGQPEKGVMPFLQVRVQLWLRELRRMVASVGPAPMLRHFDDLQNPQLPLHLPVMHCRECHATAWGCVKPEGEPTLRPDLQLFYSAWFGRKPDAVLLYPLTEGEKAPAEGERYLCSTCLTLHPRNASCPDCSRPMLRVWMPSLLKQRTVNGEPRLEVSNDCPCCQARASVLILGSRAASLASVAISDLFGSEFNDDHRVIAFSDSVQDAAHRAGFFGARTYSQVIRQAIARVVRAKGDGMPLARLIDEVPEHWRQIVNDDRKFVGMFIAPNMEWLSDYQTLVSDDALPARSDLVGLVTKRMRWDTLVEFGLRSRLGRTLERSGVAMVEVSPNELRETARHLAHVLREELGTLRDISDAQVMVFLLGVMRRLRQTGAFYDEAMEPYVRERGKTFALSQLGGREKYFPGYGPQAAPPAALTINPVSSNFETILSRQAGWYLGWFNKCLAIESLLATAEYEQVYRFAVQRLEQDGWLRQLEAGGDPVWLLKPQRWQVTANLAEMVCDCCGHRQMVVARYFKEWQNSPCMRHGCLGRYQVGDISLGNESYRSRPIRLVASEHTGLMGGEQRKKIENSFMRVLGRQPWDVNLLSATPTLEMGINIGDLSTVLLCSIPPAQANYLQRIGRAGRTDGNALALAIANGHNHDNYFYEQPLEMLAGSVSTPGVFLRAISVLERQLIAWCFDRWADTGIDESAIPGVMQAVLDTIQNDKKNGFPHNLLAFIDQNAKSLLDGFLKLFPALESNEREHLATFLLGGKGNESTLSWRILDRLNQVKNERLSLRKRVDGLKKQIEQLEAMPADEERDLRLKGLKEERQGLVARMAQINRRLTLNYFTDEGLLPNYAFPEEGVTLKSVILRRREPREAGDGVDADQRGRYEVESLDFQRSSEAALSELAPENRFYAAAHQLNIEQVDLNVSRPETWRLCSECHYAEDVTQSLSKHSVCPKCGSPQWADVGQQRTLLRLRQVYARADSRFDRIADDSDQREPVFYQRQLLVDIPDDAVTAAYKLDNENLPFGFEFLSRAIFREINFGPRGGEGDGFSVAGKLDSRKGFKICSKCGMVKRDRLRRGQFAHALDCPYARSGVPENTVEWIDSLFLYRELRSEAIRILLPLAEVAYSEGVRHSFIAALNMALKLHFKGDVSHLRITEMSEPARETGSARHYLVLYDSIPGGSGYLKELMRDPANLMSLLKTAHEKLRDCSCASDEHRDGCYRCLLAYRDSRNMPKISRKQAQQLFGQILESADLLKKVEGLSDTNTASSLLESPLEKRFVDALDARFQLKKRKVNGKAGYWFTIGTNHWELEPQVDFGPAEGVVFPTRADFVIRPVREADRKPANEWLVYTDGFAPHYANLLDDTLKRQSLIMSGRRVLVLAWDDVPEPGKAPPVPASEVLSAGRQVQGLKLFDQLAKTGQLQSSASLSHFIAKGSFTWLEQWLKEPEPTALALQQSALMTLMSWLSIDMGKLPKWELAYNELTHVVPYTLLSAIEGNPGAVGGLLSTVGKQWNGITTFVRVPQAAMASLTKLKQEAEVYLCIDDSLAELSKEFKNQWRAYWQAFNLLQFAPCFTATCRTGIAKHNYDSVLINWPVRGVTVEQVELPLANQWGVNLQDCFIDPISLDAMQTSGLPAPQVGLDLTSGDMTVATAELCWVERKIAVFCESPDQLPQIDGWIFFSTDADGWLEALMAKFKEQNQ